MIRVDVPGVGLVAVSPHALDRMRERKITEDALSRAILSDLRKWRAACALAAPEAGVRATFGDLGLVLGEFEGEKCVVTLYWERE